MVDSREVEVDLMVKVGDLKIMCKIKENLNGKVMTETRPNGKVVILTEEVLILTKEEEILILEVVKRDIDLLNIDPLKVGKVT